MHPLPDYNLQYYQGSGKLTGQVALITGGDSGIGRAVAILFAREGANITIVYYDEHQDAQQTKTLVEQEGKKCLLLPGDIKDSSFCHQAVEQTVEQFNDLTILVNNAAVQFPQQDLRDITDEQLDLTFRTNLYSYFYFARSALPYLEKKQGTIINTTSVTAYRGSDHLLDYSSTKGAIVTFTRSLARLLAPKVRVNGVAPGPVWTPLIPSSFSAEEVAKFGQDVPLGRPGQPDEIAPSFVFLASPDSSYMTGQILHPNGGEIINT